MPNQHTKFPTPAAVRFWAKVEFTDTCWLWTGARTSKGYGEFHHDNRIRPAHRWAYEFCVGPIPEGLTLDHLCRVHHCVFPVHLEPVTNRVNLLRGEGITAQQVRQTHCKRGHPFNEANTYRWRGHRFCRTCQRGRDTARAALRLDSLAKAMEEK